MLSYSSPVLMTETIVWTHHSYIFLIARILHYEWTADITSRQEANWSSRYYMAGSELLLGPVNARLTTLYTILAYVRLHRPCS